MEIKEGIEVLTNLFKTRDWFHSVDVEQYGRIVVYIKYACQETLHDIPDMVAGRQVLVHFAASKYATREQFTNSDQKKREENIPIPLVTQVVDVTDEAELVDADGAVELPSSFLQFDLNDLCKELDRLERMCGSNALQDIFYEVHDGRNAVTNLSARYPDVRKSLEQLYQDYGFDVIYEELDG
jgi:hypothetical protein